MGSHGPAFPPPPVLFCAVNILVAFLLVLYNQWLLNGDSFAPWKIFGNLWRHFCHKWGWGLLESSRDTAKHPTPHRTSPHNKKLPGPNVTSARVEKLSVMYTCAVLYDVYVFV